MYVAIKYPEQFPLAGYDLALFDWSVRNLFDGNSFSSYRLEKLAKRIHVDLSDERKKTLSEEFDDLGWSEFAELPDVVAKGLPARVGEFLGVEIQLLRVPPVSVRRWFGRVLPWSALMLVLGLGAFVVESVASSVGAQHRVQLAPTFDFAPPSVPSVPVLLDRSKSGSVGLTNRAHEIPPIADYTAVTRTTTAAAAHVLSSVALQPGQAYRVRFSVEPVPAPPADAAGGSE